MKTAKFALAIAISSIILSFGFAGLTTNASAGHIWGPYNFLECDNQFISAITAGEGHSAVVGGDAISNYYYYRAEYRVLLDGNMNAAGFPWVAGTITIDMNEIIDWVWVRPAGGIGWYSQSGGVGSERVVFGLGGIGFASWDITIGTVNFHSESPTHLIEITAFAPGPGHAFDSADLDTEWPC